MRLIQRAFKSMDGLEWLMSGDDRKATANAHRHLLNHFNIKEITQSLGKCHGQRYSARLVLYLCRIKPAGVLWSIAVSLRCASCMH